MCANVLGTDTFGSLTNLSRLEEKKSDLLFLMSDFHLSSNQEQMMMMMTLLRVKSNLKKVLETMRCFFLSFIWVMLVCFYNKIVLNEKFALQVNSSILYLGTRVSKCPCLDGHFSYLYFCR